MVEPLVQLKKIQQRQLLSPVIVISLTTGACRVTILIKHIELTNLWKFWTAASIPSLNATVF